jgi:ligand-binding sensor domain-containing protein
VVWAGTRRGLARIEGGRITVLTPRQGLAHERISAVYRDRAGRLWIGTQAGLNRLEPDGRVTLFTTRSGLANDFVRALLEDRHGNLWIATYGGLSRLTGDRFSSFTATDGLTSSAVIALYEDREGSLWVGTEGGGLNRLKEGKVTSFTQTHGLTSRNVYAVAGDGQLGVWVASYADGVSHLVNGRATPLPRQQPLAGVRLRALLQDRRGGLWIGTEKGLYLHRGGSFVTYTTRDGLPADTVRALYEDRQGRLWVGTDGGGLVCFEAGRFRTYTTADGLGSNEVRVIYETRDRSLWIGTYAGLSRLRDGTLSTLHVSDGLADERVRALYEDEGGVLWIATYGGGLSRLKDGKLASFTSRDGLLSDALYSVLEDDEGRLWMSCNRGIFRVAKRNLEDFAAGRVKSIESIAFDDSDGMKSRECNGGSPGGWKTADGRMWFPTLDGVAMVDPRQIKSNTLPPPVLIEQALVNGRPLHAGDRLPPGSERFEFRYTGLGFVAPGEVRFSFKLEGYDREWVDVGPRRVAYYTHLAPGNYVFRVIAANEDGVWNRAGASLSFSLKPHFYERRWFVAGVGLVIVLTAAGFYRLRLLQHRRREAGLQERIQDALAKIKVLSGLLPICAWCRKVRDDTGYWSQIETYVKDHSQADFTHGICPDCMKTHYPQVAARYDQGGETKR